MYVVTSDARYFVVETKCNCDLIIGFMANSYFILQMYHAKSFKMSYINLCTSYFKNMRADFVQRCQKLTSQTTPEMMHEKKILIKNT